MKASIRKVLSAVLVLLLTVGMLPTALAAEASPIAEVTAPAGAAPQLGQKPAETSYTGDGYTVTTRWSRDGTALAADAVFAPGTYTETFVAAPAEGRSFAESVAFTLGTEKRDLAPLPDGTLVFEKTHELKADQPDGNQPDAGQSDPAQVISSVALLFGSPRAGEPVQPFLQDQDEEAYRAEGQWQDAPETFEAGKTYTLKVTVTAREGRSFADDVQVHDSEQTLYERTVAADHKSLTFSAGFTCKEATPPVQVRQIPEVKYTLSGKPTAGMPMITAANDLADGHYTLKAWWTLEGVPVADDAVYEAGKTYDLHLEFRAEDGFEFASPLQVNGGTLDFGAHQKTGIWVGSYTVEAPKPVASITRAGTDVFYPTLDEAIADAADGETIRVLADTSTAWTQGYYMGKSLTFRLDGHSVSFPAGFCIPGGKTVKFVGGSVTMAGVTKGCNDFGSYNFGAAIVINGSGVLELDNTAYTISGTRGDGIYGHPGSAIRVKNGSALNISGSSLNGITKDNGEAVIEVTGGSSLNITGNKAGLTNTWEVTVNNSTLNVSSNKGNGSNGSNYEFTNATVSFNDNGSFGMSAGKVTAENSTITASGNGLNGINATGKLTLTGCTTTVTGNGCDVDSQWSKPGAITVKSEALISGGSLTVTGNGGSGIRAWGGAAPLTVKDCAATVTGNTAKRSGYGGGIMSDSPVTLDDKVIIANNHAARAGDDLYVTAAIQIPAAPTALSLDGQAGNCLLKIDGWYVDAEEARWNSHDLKDLNVVPETEKSHPQGVALKAAHGIKQTSLYNQAEVKFHKVDSATGKPVADAVFTLYNDAKCTGKIDTFKTDKSGDFSIRLEAGTYFLKETQAPRGYKAPDTVYEIRVTDSETRVNRILDTAVTPSEVVEESVVDARAQVVGMTADKDGVYTLKNQAVRDITLRKVWKDDKNSEKTRPEKIEISFRENGRETERYTLSKDNDWQIVLKDLPVYDQNGKEIQYSVKELTKLKDYTTTYEDGGFTVVNTLKGKGVTPQTGDQSNIGLWIGLMAVSAVAIGGVLIFMHKKSKKAE